MAGTLATMLAEAANYIPSKCPCCNQPILDYYFRSVDHPSEEYDMQLSSPLLITNILPPPTKDQ